MIKEHGRTFWIEGKLNMKPLTRRLMTLQKNVEHLTYQATKEALQRIHNKAMDNLYNSNLKWGTSAETPNYKESIGNTVEFDIRKMPSGYRGTLRYTSPHARLQEYGGFYVYIRNPDELAMPIGKQEDHTEYFGYKIIGDIQGKYFLTSAFLTESSEVKNIFESYLQKLKAGVI